jgi:protein ImuA
MNSTLQSLRAVLADLDADRAPAKATLFPLGAPSLDEVLAGGLAQGALHEIVAPAGLADAAASSGFGLGLALRAAGERPLVWVRQDFVDAETGWLYGAGLAAFGVDPSRLIVVRASDATGVLRAASEAVHCPAVGAVLTEIWGEPRVLDLKATRRLSLAAGQSGATLIFIRLHAAPAPSAASSRWAVGAAPSTPLEANAPGRPAFTATLLRHRAGLPGRTWHVEWNRDSQSFADLAPLSRPVVPVPASRPAAAAGRWRLAG